MPESSPRTRGRLIIVAGPPASGKTTLAGQLRESLAALVLEPDAWMSALGLDRHDGELRARVERLQWQLATSLLERGQTVILDWGAFKRDKRSALRRGARERGATVELIFLTAPPDVLWRRILQRDGGSVSPSHAQFQAMLHELEPPSCAERALFDGSGDGEPSTG